MPTIGTKGENLDLLIRQGATFGPHLVTLTNPDTSPVNLTGCTVRGQIRKTATLPLSTGVALTCTVTNAAAGQFTISISDEDTTLLTADPDSETADASTYVWDLELEDAGGNVIPLMYGVANVWREVTKVS